MKDIRLKITLPHPKGDIVKGSIYKYEDGIYVHRNKDGVSISTTVSNAVKLAPDTFEYVEK